MNTAIVVSENALAPLDKTQIIRMTDMVMASVMVQGSKMRPEQAAQLAVISLSTGLSPLTGELYMTPKGPMIGVMGYERKAIEYMDAHLPGTSYHVAYRSAEPKIDADFDPSQGDIGYVCILTRDDWDANWQGSFSKNIRLMKEAGLTGRELVDLARELTGNKPHVEYVGVVDHRENFAANGKPEMMDRHERARKRARKGAIKHAFPRMDIPDPLQVMARTAESRMIAEAAQVVQAPRIATTTDETPDEIINSLGYPVEAPAPEFTSGTGFIKYGYPVEWLDGIVSKNYAISRQEAQDLLDYSTTVDPAAPLTADLVIKWGSRFMAKYSAGEEIEDAIRYADTELSNHIGTLDASS